ncbi:MAG: M15 family metallopeptidase [Limnothrix sp.]
MKPYQSVPIVECGEPLAAIPLDLFAVVTPHPYVAAGADYGDRHDPYFLREVVLRRLIAAQACLQKIHVDLSMQIFDAYRPIVVQQFMVDYTFAQLKGDRQLDGRETEKIWEKVYQFWAAPSDNLETPPPHSTGAAVDLTIVRDSGLVLDMGGEIDEIGDRSHPDYYADSPKPVEQHYHANRVLLRTVMAKAGFVQHKNEWWHFSYGDQMWAWQKGKAIAHYGRI